MMNDDIAPADAPPKSTWGGRRPGAGRPRKVWSGCAECNRLHALIAELARAAKQQVR
jgi:hypothetical protein